MKKFHILLVLPFLAFLINSCSSTHDFAGTYPKNTVTGTGIGGHAAYNDVAISKPNSTSVVETKNLPPVDATLTAQLTTGENLTRVEKFGVKLDAFLLKQAGVTDISKFSATDYFAQHKGLFSWREKLGNKIYARVYSKYMARHSAADMGGASGALAIVSLVFGIVALVGWYGAFLFGLVAIITGALSLAGGGKRPVMAILGIIFGVIAIVTWAVIVGFFHGIIF